jgi:cytochrome c oxidase subunit II
MISRSSKIAIYGAVAAFAVVLVAGYLIAAEEEEKGEQVIKITAKKFEFSPKEITLKKGAPMVLELTSLDRLHGFNCPGLKIRTDIQPGKVAKLRVTPDKAGSFPFFCDIFCGSGHGEMIGTITVTE